jgi:hypothetical protein
MAVAGLVAWVLAGPLRAIWRTAMEYQLWKGRIEGATVAALLVLGFVLVVRGDRK